jgi:hypothetical protein
MSLKESLCFILIIKDDTGVGNSIKNLFPFSISQIVDSVNDLVVEAKSPF